MSTTANSPKGNLEILNAAMRSLTDLQRTLIDVSSFSGASAILYNELLQRVHGCCDAARRARHMAHLEHLEHKEEKKAGRDTHLDTLRLNIILGYERTLPNDTRGLYGKPYVAQFYYEGCEGRPMSADSIHTREKLDAAINVALREECPPELRVDDSTKNAEALPPVPRGPIHLPHAAETMAETALQEPVNAEDKDAKDVAQRYEWATRSEQERAHERANWDPSQKASYPAPNTKAVKDPTGGPDLHVPADVEVVPNNATDDLTCGTVRVPAQGCVFDAKQLTDEELVYSIRELRAQLGAENIANYEAEAKARGLDAYKIDGAPLTVPICTTADQALAAGKLFLAGSGTLPKNVDSDTPPGVLSCDTAAFEKGAKQAQQAEMKRKAEGTT